MSTGVLYTRFCPVFQKLSPKSQHMWFCQPCRTPWITTVAFQNQDGDSGTSHGYLSARTHGHRHQGTRTLQSEHAPGCDVTGPLHPPSPHSASPQTWPESPPWLLVLALWVLPSAPPFLSKTSLKFILSSCPYPVLSTLGQGKTSILKMAGRFELVFLSLKCVFTHDCWMPQLQLTGMIQWRDRSQYMIKWREQKSSYRVIPRIGRWRKSRLLSGNDIRIGILRDGEWAQGNPLRG